MEIFGLFIFLGCALLSLALLSFRESKEQKRFWAWREQLTENQTHICNELSKIAFLINEFNEYEIRRFEKKD